MKYTGLDTGRSLTIKALIFSHIIPAIMLALAADTFAAIPLITDDTGTQGKGNFQLELFGRYGNDSEETITAKTGDLSVTLTYGLFNNVDLIFSVPYVSVRTEEPGPIIKEAALSAVQCEAKWRFYDHENWSFALKPGLTIPTWDKRRGLGAGKATYHILFITTYNSGEEKYAPEGRRIESPEEKAVHHVEWALHLNADYIRSVNVAEERKNLWLFSVAGEIEFIEDFRLVADMGIGTNPHRNSGTPPAYILGGLIYSLRENLDFGLGVEGGLTKPATDISVRGGITFRF